ncbi:histidine kinase [Methylocapsa polymorpha]|uniref:Oxygen sensor histidine kinase NreB n=1 Tax=Methylocapsa polymorpha TaxID=3080828 RepID=A0ABZ0HWP3_9HYPH|nr:histidine kinase [Methylocapsa sp. RX1]
MIRVALGALACAFAAAAFVITETRMDMNHGLKAKVELMAGKLSLQPVRFQTGFDHDERLPDWGFLADKLLDEGACIRFENADRQQVYASCLGVAASSAATPQWFSALYRTVFSPVRPVRRTIETHGEAIATIEVSLDPTLGEARAWTETRRIMSVTASAIALLSVIVYFAIDRALRPTLAIQAGIDRLAGGDLSYRLPQVPLIELQRIGEVINRMAARLETAMAERAELARRLAIAQEEERRHLARELHDEFGQNLAAINAIAASVGATAKIACPELMPEAVSLSQIAMNMMNELRNTLARLRPAVVDEIGLVESLKDLVVGWNGRLGATRFTFSEKGDLHELPDAVAVTIFRIAQEGVTNAARHAGARNVNVTLERLNGYPAPSAESAVQLTIEDDGKGLGPHENAGAGAGLAGIRERVAIFKGRMDLRSEASAGAKLSVIIPIALTAQEVA